MLTVHLLVAGRNVVVRPLAGSEDVLLTESRAPDLGLALELLRQVAREVDGAPLDPTELPVGDVDALLLRLRQMLVSDVVHAETVCAAPGCRTRVDVTFSIADYLEHHLPTPPADVEPSEEKGWFTLARDDVSFRLPAVADQLAIAPAADPEEALLRRCVRPANVTEAMRERVEVAMEAMAPSLCSEMVGTCPNCAAQVVASFDPVPFTLRELRDRAAFVYDDVLAIAHHTHWCEADILALPTARRARYAELASRHARERTSI